MCVAAMTGISTTVRPVRPASARADGDGEDREGGVPDRSRLKGAPDGSRLKGAPDRSRLGVRPTETSLGRARLKPIGRRRPVQNLPMPAQSAAAQAHSAVNAWTAVRAAPCSATSSRTRGPHFPQQPVTPSSARRSRTFCAPSSRLERMRRSETFRQTQTIISTLP